MLHCNCSWCTCSSWTPLRPVIIFLERVRRHIAGAGRGAYRQADVCAAVPRAVLPSATWQNPISCVHQKSLGLKCLQDCHTSSKIRQVRIQFVVASGEEGFVISGRLSRAKQDSGESNSFSDFVIFGRLSRPQQKNGRPIKTMNHLRVCLFSTKNKRPKIIIAPLHVRLAPPWQSSWSVLSFFHPSSCPNFGFDV